MVVKATVARMRIAEVPTILSPDGRSRPPHLRSWSDGWRHLRFLLLYSPRWLFLCPGLAMFILGLLAMVWLLPRPRTIGGVTFDVHTLLYSAVLIVIGFQSVLFWIFAKIYGMRERIVPPDPWFQQAVRIITVERGLIAGAFLLVLGVALGVSATAFWSSQDFGSLRTSETMRYVIPSATMILLAFQMVYAAFFISVLDIRASVAPAAPEPEPIPGTAEPQPRSAQ
jgi:hypothetical protein